MDYFAIGVAVFFVPFVLGYLLGKRARPKPVDNHFDQPWTPIPPSHFVDLAKPETEADDGDEDDAIDRLITATCDAIDELEGPLAGVMLGHEATVPFDKELPITVNNQVIVVTRGNPDADEYAEGDKSNIRLFWEANSTREEIPLDYDEGYEIESAIVNWEDRLADFTDGEARRLANDIAKRFLASS